MVLIQLTVDYVLAPLVLRCFTDDYILPISINIKNYSERDSILAFVVEWLILTSGSYFFLHFSTFSISVFVLLTNYIIGQFDLITQYTAQLNLRNELTFYKATKELMTMHLETLR